MTARAPAPGLGTPTTAGGISRDNEGLSNSLIPPSPQDHTPLWVWMQRAARRWRYRDGESLQTVATRLGCTEATVRALLGERTAADVRNFGSDCQGHTSEARS